MLVLLSGPIGSGKTTLCRRLATLAGERGVAVAGVLTPALVENGRKVGIRAVDLASGQVRLLACNDRDLGGTRVGQYAFDDRTLDWMPTLCGPTLCEASLREGALSATALVFVDEIGPLELDRDGGLARLIPLFAQPRDWPTVVVVRDTLLDRFLARVREAKPHVVTLDASCRDAAWNAMRELLFGRKE